MKQIQARAWALTALVALCIYGLACWYPPAWSPDSQQIVFPSFVAGEKDGAQCTALVMSDLRANVLRKVASAAEGELLSPAAWSPDGKWIAYLKFVPNPADEAKAAWSLMLQEAATGKERLLRKGEILADKNEAVPMLAYPPQWCADSQRLAVVEPMEERLRLLIVDLAGNVRQEAIVQQPVVPVAGATISPDGRWVAYLAKQGEAFDLMVIDLAALSAKMIFQTKSEKHGIPARPTWAADSRSLYFASLQQDAQGKPYSALQRYDLGTGLTEVVLEKPGAKIVGISLAAKSGSIALDCQKEQLRTLEILPARGSKPILVHAADGKQGYFGAAISPDGAWVALVQSLEAKGAFPGLLISSDGREVRFFAPTQRESAALPEAAMARLAAALEVVNVRAEIERAAPNVGDPAHTVAAVIAVCDRLAKEHEGHFLQQALDVGKVACLLTIVEDLPQGAAPQYADAAGRLLMEFLERHPNHPAELALRERIAALRGEVRQAK